ncbi:ADP-ribosylglycohydrolase family protein [Lachnoclostridium sp. Marseille-P6806]|uniref:ADP-ribosylglycohydrolase family protein n=1 Tax=Lachnoclostridium sp. Marseille-P6806 TaxID=2364793 RepID=UPI00102F984A|nr:ADP-ribosylglycohydrolase family protein [Lachnoclostridium sp. Marseille-P6806]
MNDSKRITRARITIADMLKGNGEIEAAILAYHENRTNQNVMAVMEAVRRQLAPGTRVLLAAAPAAETVDFRNPKQKQRRFVLNRLKSPDGKEAAVLFTSEAEQKKGAQTPVLAIPLREALEMIGRTEALQGVLINPWGKRFLLPRTTIAAILKTEDARRTTAETAKRSHVFIQKADAASAGAQGAVSMEDAGKENREAGTAVFADETEEKPRRIRIFVPSYPAGGTAQEKREAGALLMRGCAAALELSRGGELHSIAFPGASQGGFPLEEQIPAVISAATGWLAAHQDYVMQVVMCAPDEETYRRYQAFMENIRKLREEAEKRRKETLAAQGGSAGAAAGPGPQLQITLRRPESGLTAAAVTGLLVGEAFGMASPPLRCGDGTAESTPDSAGAETLWSAAGSMTLAALDSLSAKKAPDFGDVMEKLFRWRMYGEYTASGSASGIGETTDAAIMNYARGMTPLSCGIGDESADGSGALVRILPFSLLLCRQGQPFCTDADRALLHQASALTHAHPRSKAVCELYSLIVRNLVTHLPKENAEKHVQDAVNEMLLFYRVGEEAADEEERKALEEHREAVKDYDAVRSALADLTRLHAISRFRALPESALSGDGRAVDTLETAVWCLLNSSSFRECIGKAAALGRGAAAAGRAAAAAGALAGIFYGAAAVPEEERAALARREWVEELCESYQSRWLGAN